MFAVGSRDVHWPVNNAQAESAQLPIHEDAWFEAMVPNTLDLAEMARLAIGGLTGPTDPDADYEVYSIGG